MQRSTAALRRLASAYDRYNTRRPLSTKAATCGVLLGGGDILCQGLESSAPFDPQRTGRMVTWGGLFNGPAGHVFYAQLDRFITMAGARGIACKIAVDQLLFTPPLTFAFYGVTCVTSAVRSVTYLHPARHVRHIRRLVTWP